VSALVRPPVLVAVPETRHSDRSDATRGGGIRIDLPSAAPVARQSIRATLTDAELLGLVASGHPPALTTILQRHRRAAIALASRICGVELAEEALQDAFVQISTASDTYRPEIGPARNWILGIVRHRAIDILRRNARHVSRRADAAELDDVASDDPVDAAVERQEQARTVRAMIRRLPDEQALIIRMAYFDDLSHTQIATMTGLPLGTVKSRIRLGLTRLRRPLLGDQAIAPALSRP
jgi:RNA polymerase sigma-70 factor, ECF subfamily